MKRNFLFLWKRWTCAVPIALWMCLSLLAAYNAATWKPVPMGESDDYMLATVALEKRGALTISPEDVTQASSDFPDFGGYLKQCYSANGCASVIVNGVKKPIVDKNGNVYPWYFVTYSALCIPAKKALNLIGIPMSYAFAATNALLYSLALLIVLLFHKCSVLFKSCALLVLGLNPVLFYIPWLSSEVFVFACVVMALVFWMNGRYAPAALFTALGGSMNATVMAMGFFIVAAKLQETIGTRRDRSILSTYLGEWRQYAVLALCFLPGLIPFIYYRFRLGVFSLQTLAGYSMPSSAPANFLAYLVDLNFGMLPYFPVATLALPILLIVAVAKKSWRLLSAMVAFLAIVLAYSPMGNVDCGMSGIARYNSWSAPLLLFGEMLVLRDVLPKAASSKVVGAFTAATSAISIAILATYGLPFAKNVTDGRMTPIAQYALDHFPAQVWMRPQTFCKRETRKKVPPNPAFRFLANPELCPVFHVSRVGTVTKALVTNRSFSQFLEGLRLDEESRTMLLRKKRTQLADGKPYYVNIPPKLQVKIRLKAFLSQEIPGFADDVIPLAALHTNGNIQKGAFVLSQNEVQFGPYISLPPGRYEATVLCDNADALAVRVTADAGQTMIEARESEVLQEGVRLSFSAETMLRNFEVVSQNTTRDVCRIYGLRLREVQIFN